MDSLWLKIHTFCGTASAVDWLNASKVALQLIIIGYAIIWTWGRIRGTQAERLVKGLMVLTSLWIASWLLGLTLITSILQQLIPAALLSLLIIFQPELRRGLGYLGRNAFRVDLSLADSQRDRAIQLIAEIINAVRELSRERTGALIVIEPPEGSRDYLSPGTPINADVSANLILSIFTQKSPLHDGAVIIRLNKIVAAGVILPVSDNPKLSYRYGTRHRAAIGLSEIYDGLCIVVSEETGSISAANRGMLVRYNTADELSDALSYFFGQGTSSPRTDSPLQAFLALFGTGNRPKSDTAGDIAKETGGQPEREREKESLPAGAAPREEDRKASAHMPPFTPDDGIPPQASTEAV